MDDAQQNHLKAYGLTYNAIKAGASAEWLLNYRGGSFLLGDTPELRRQAGLAGITFEPVDDAKLGQIRREIARTTWRRSRSRKRRRSPSTRRPTRCRGTTPSRSRSNTPGIEYTPIYDDEVERGDLSKYDWLHLHHEDFTGQLNKFYLTYRDAPWFIDLLQKNTAAAKRLGFANIPALKKDVAEKIREFVDRGGFLFAMCGATETLELAIAGQQRRHRAERSSTARRWIPTPTSKMDWKRTFAFQRRAPRACRRS